jgi:hypothetical protein
MTYSLRSYLLLTTGISAVFALGLYFISGILEDDDGSIWVVSQLLVSTYLIISVITGVVLFNYVYKRPGLFVRAFMGASTVKFLVLLGVMIGCILNFRDDKGFLVILFFILYVFFAVFEKIYIFRAFKKINQDLESESSEV